jgi:peptide/nickel transport system permease protein
MALLVTTPTAVPRRWAFLPRLAVPYSGVIGGAVIVILIVVAILAPVIAPFDPDAIDAANGLGPISPQHWLGTDNLGRDIFSRIVFGSRLSLLGPLLVVAISTAVGVPLGLLGAYRGGAVDMILGRTWDLLLGFPALLLAIALVATFSPGFSTAVIAISIIYVPLLARVVRSVVVVERQKAYVQAARVLGYGVFRVSFRHVLPTAVPTIVAQSTLNFGYALLDLAGLAFLGMGVQPPTADWGVMLSDGRKVILLSPNEVLSASITIAVAVVAFNLLGDALTHRLAERT